MICPFMFFIEYQSIFQMQDNADLSSLSNETGPSSIGLFNGIYFTKIRLCKLSRFRRFGTKAAGERSKMTFKKHFVVFIFFKMKIERTLSLSFKSTKFLLLKVFEKQRSLPDRN